MPALLKITNLSLGYGDKEIFSNINLSQEEGELIALVGSNGRGKSTLLKTIANIEPIYNDGSILFNGRGIDSFTKKERSELITFVTPITDRTEYLTVEDMVGINTYYRSNWIGKIAESDRKKISESLDVVGLNGFEERYCNSLSDGEFQRATIAGALVQDSKIILLDEPTAFLDIANKFLITRLLKDISKSRKKLIVFSTHDLSLALMICDKLWVMTSEGFYCGTPDELIKENVLNKIFNLQGVVFDPELKMFREIDKESH